MSTLIDIETEDAFNKHSDSLPPTALQIIYFKAEWAAPCKQMTTVLQTLASTYPVTQPISTSWIAMDAEAVADVSEAFEVTAVPFLVLRRNKQVLETVSGSDATKVRAAIEKHVKAPAGISQNGTSTVATSSENGTKNTDSHSPAAKDLVTAPESSSEAKSSKEALHERLSSLVKAAPVMLFMKGTPSAPQCGFSRQLVALLREKSIKYGFFNILADDEVRQGMKEFADWPTFPQLWVDGELVGGLDIVKEEISNDPEYLKAYSVTKTSATATA